jgi:broad specificity phosphatase PhoE
MAGITSKESTEQPITKTIYLIRHAESEENQRMQSLNTVVNSVFRFTLPSSKDVMESLQLLNVVSQVDTPVSPTGEQQILEMAQILASQDFLKEVDLVMHSPLQRARDTSKGLLQCLAGNATIEELKHMEVSRVIETPLLVERTPTEWLPGQLETTLRKRILQWEAFVLEQPEERIAVVGHSQFFKAMLNLDFKFGNCHVWQVQLSNQITTHETTTENSSFPNLPPQWSGLKQLYDLNKSNQTASTCIDPPQSDNQE